MNCMGLLSGIAALALLHVCQGSGLNVTLIHGSTTIDTGKLFSFSCFANGTTETVEFNVYVVNNSSDNIATHLIYRRASPAKMNYSVTEVCDDDNGAGLICEGITKDKSGNSTVVYLNVLFPPTFEEGEGNTIRMFNLSSKYTLNYTVIPGNPNMTDIKLSTTASSKGNVCNVTNTTTVSKFEINGTVLANAGNYSAVVNNSYGSTKLTYNVFVGGPLNASLFKISCSQSTNRTMLSISCKVKDGNSAPATLLQFDMPGLGLHQTINLEFGDIPVDKTFSPLFTTSLETLFSGDYSLEISGSNGLSTTVADIYSQSFYLAGLSNVTIKPNNSSYQVLGAGTNFTFTCSVEQPNGTLVNPPITLEIPGDAEKLGKVANVTTKTNITFIYPITNYTDDQTVFVCQFSNNSHVWSSPNLTLTVFYAPLFTNNIKDDSVLTEIATGKNRNLTCTVVEQHGPKALNLTVTTTPSIPSFNPVHINDSSLVVVITNASHPKVDYVCNACNGDSLCSYLNFTTYVGGPPNNASLHNLSIRVTESSINEYTLTLVGNFTDNSNVPVTSLKYVINQTNVTKDIDVEAPKTGMTQLVHSTETYKSNQLGGKSYFTVDIWAVNYLGSLALTTVNVTVPGLNVTLIHGSTTVGTGEAFNFSCFANGTTETVYFKLYVVNNSSDNIATHLTTLSIPPARMNYSVTEIYDDDNGAGLICEGTTLKDNSKKVKSSGNSTVVYLNVLFPPTFKEGEGNTIRMFNLSSNYSLNYTVIPGNPNMTDIKLSTTAPSKGNVRNVTNTTTVSKFEINGAVLTNAGNYSAIVNNSYGSNKLTYNIFVGGPLNASLFKISCNQSTNRTMLSISCKVKDGNSAPATLLQFDMPGLGLHQTINLEFGDIPVDKTFSPLFTTSLETLFSGDYSLGISGSNGLSTTLADIYSQSFYLAGLSNFTIKPNNSSYQVLGARTNFTFTCSIEQPNGTLVNPPITLETPGDPEKLAKVTNVTTKTNITFTYHITNYTDDQTVFVCQFSNNSHVWSSPNLTLTVFYGPHYTHSNMSQKDVINGTELTVNVGLMSNPPVANYTWMTNRTKLSNSSNIVVTPGELRFTPLLVGSKGNYSVYECNNISCNSLVFIISDVYYAPLFANNMRDDSVLTEIATNKSRNLTCTVVEQHGPKPLNLTMTTTPAIKGFKPVHINDSSLVVVITNASRPKVDYVCNACTGDSLCSYLNYTTYVGGPPNNASLRNLSVSAAESSINEYTLTLVGNFTDRSNVPVTSLKYVINQTNVTKDIAVEAPLTGVTQLVRSTETYKSDQLGGGSYFIVNIWAVNYLGSSVLTTANVTVPLVPATPSPSSAPAKSNTTTIVVAIVVPVVFIVLLIAAVVGGYMYYKKNKRTNKYVPINADNANIDEASGGVYGST